MLCSFDEAILAEVSRSPLLVDQIARLVGRPVKKVSARMRRLFLFGGYVRRCRTYSREYLYHTGRTPSPIQFRHTSMTAEFRVQTAIAFPGGGQGLFAEFLYGHELKMSAVRPDGALVVDRSQLFFIESDCSTERLSSLFAYSVEAKLKAYETLYETGKYKDTFSGSFRGFRVIVVLTSAVRLQHLRALVEQRGFDFVLLTTIEELSTRGLLAPIFVTHNDRRVSVLGRTA